MSETLMVKGPNHLPAVSETVQSRERMAQLPNLENAAIDLAAMRDQSQKELLTILNNIQGNKCLVLDPKLAGSLSLIVETSILNEHGVLELHHLTSEPLQTQCTKVVYLVRTHLALMKLMSSQVHIDLSQGLQRDYFVYFVPRRALACEKLLEDEKVHKLMTIGEYPLYIYPLDADVFSFELDLAYRELAVDGDKSSLWHVAKAIHSIELSSSGLIPNVIAKGAASSRVAEILEKLHVEEPVNDNFVVEDTNTIDTLVLIDREADMVTPMRTQLTYEGVIDEILRVRNGVVEVDSSIVDDVQQEGKTKMKIRLDSSGRLFRDTRDLFFGDVCEILHRKAESLKRDYYGFTREAAETTMSELKGFVKKMTWWRREVTMHVNLARHLATFACETSFHERIEIERKMIESESHGKCLDYIEEMIDSREDLVSVLRLLVLFSATNGGLPATEFDDLRRGVLQSYGFRYMGVLRNLERAGLIKKQEPKESILQKIKQALKLVNDSDSDSDTVRVGEVSTGDAAPLSVRLIEESLKLSPGPCFEMKPIDSATPPPLFWGRRRCVMVVFVGGVTFAEIAALRLLSSREGMEYVFIIGTTKIVNGTTLIETFFDNNDLG